MLVVPTVLGGSAHVRQRIVRPETGHAVSIRRGGDALADKARATTITRIMNRDRPLIVTTIRTNGAAQERSLLILAGVDLVTPNGALTVPHR
jgi:hypothetical protein